MSRLTVSAKALFFAASMLAAPALSAPVQMSDAQLGAASAGVQFSITDRVADQASVHADVTDPLLVNAWGLSQGPGTFLWVANNGTDSSTLYDTTQSKWSKAPLNVKVPGAPTGTVFVGVKDAFKFTSNGKTDTTLFAFDTEGGQIEAWSPNVDLNNAIVVVDKSNKGAIYKGLTLGMDEKKPLLFAADFGRGKIEAFDSNYHLVRSFTDPYLPANYTPFNVQTLNGQLYVTFALRQPGAHDETAGPGLGIVDVFDTDGHLERRLVSGGKLNAPWGLAIAPASFGKFGGDLLVGNFGDGRIDVYDPHDGHFVGTLSNGGGGGKIKVDGLWALMTGPNGSITFSSGPNDESHGLVGSIAAATPMWSHHEVATMMEMGHH